MELFVEGFWSVFNSSGLGTGAAVVLIAFGYVLVCASLVGGLFWLIPRVWR